MTNKSLEDFKTENPFDPNGVESQFMWRLRIDRLHKAYLAEQAKSTELEFDAFIPDVGDPNYGELTEDQKKFNDALDRFSIFDAYNRWAGPTKGYVSQKDNKPVRCPNPDHEDIHPSCWMVANKDGNLRGAGNCAKCGGFDKFGIAAWYMGLQPSDCKTSRFAEIAKTFGEGFSVVQIKSITGETITVAPEAVTETEPANSGAGTEVAYIGDGAAAQALAESVADDKAKAKEQAGIAINWRDFVPQDTFLWEYLQVCCQDDLPEEFHFWNGLLALGLAVGRNRMLFEAKPVKANLYVCLIGKSGGGKSRSLDHLDNVLQQALPYDYTDDPPIGAAIMSGIQSGEVLIKSFQHEVIDPVTNKPAARGDVRGLIKFDEFAELVRKANRSSSTLGTTITQMYDAPSFARTTGMKHGNIVAKNVFPSAISTTQYASIRTLITKDDQTSGFANRWVFVTGIQKKRRAINYYMPDYSRAVSKLSGIQTGALAPDYLRLTENALKIWQDFFDNVLEPWVEARESTDMVERFDLLFKKLALLFAINDRADVVGETHMRNALGLFEYLGGAVGRFEEEASVTEDSQLMEKILQQVERLTAKGANQPTARNIGLSLSKKYCTPEQLRKMLSNMVQLGYIEELAIPAGPKGGRPTKVFKIATGA